MLQPTSLATPPVIRTGKTAEADVERHVRVDEVVAEQERDPQVADARQLVADLARDVGARAERGDDHVVDRHVAAAVQVQDQVGAVGAGPEPLERRPGAVVDERLELLRDLPRLRAVVVVAVRRVVHRRCDLLREVGERGHDLVVEGADDVRARVERVADERDAGRPSRRRRAPISSFVQQLRQDLEQQPPVERLAVEERLQPGGQRRRARERLGGALQLDRVGERDARDLDAEDAAGVAGRVGVGRVLALEIRVGALERDVEVAEEVAEGEGAVVVDRVVERVVAGVARVLHDAQLGAELDHADARILCVRITVDVLDGRSQVHLDRTDARGQTDVGRLQPPFDLGLRRVEHGDVRRQVELQRDADVQLGSCGVLEAQVAFGVERDEIAGRAEVGVQRDGQRVDVAVGGLAQRACAAAGVVRGAEAEAEPDDQILGAVADDLVLVAVVPVHVRAGARQVVVLDEGDRAVLVVRLVDQQVAVDRVARAAGGEVGVVVVEDLRGRGAVVVAVDDRRVVATVGEVEEVELEDVRVSDAELVLDQLLELLQRRRRRGLRQLGGVVAGRVGELDHRAPLVDQRVVGGHAVLVAERDLHPCRRRRANRVEHAVRRRAAERVDRVADDQVAVGPQRLRGPGDRVRLDRRDRTAIDELVVGQDRQVERPADIVVAGVGPVGVPRAVDRRERRAAEIVERLLDRLDLPDQLLRRDPDQRNLLVRLARRDLVDLLDQLVEVVEDDPEQGEDVALDRVLVAVLPLVVVRRCRRSACRRRGCS